MKLSRLLSRFLKERRYTLKERTILYYKQVSEIYIEGSQLDKEVVSITSGDLNKYALWLAGKLAEDGKSKQKFSHSTIKVVKSLISRGLRFAKRQGLIENVPTFEVEIKPTNPKKVESLSKLEQEKIESFILGRKKVYSYGVLLSLYTGLRIGELLSIRWDAVDLKARTFVVRATSCKISKDGKTIFLEGSPKTLSSIRELPISKAVLQLLKEIKQEQNGASDYVMARANGKRIDMRTYQDSFSRLLSSMFNAIKNHLF